jgi:hypothetical protein
MWLPDTGGNRDIKTEINIKKYNKIWNDIHKEIKNRLDSENVSCYSVQKSIVPEMS